MLTYAVSFLDTFGMREVDLLPVEHSIDSKYFSRRYISHIQYRMIINGFFLQGWGFCHRVCDRDHDIFTHTLKKVQLTILSEKLCEEVGNAEADNLGNENVVNVRKELCGAFVNLANVTLFNYTILKKNAERFVNFF